MLDTANRLILKNQADMCVYFMRFSWLEGTLTASANRHFQAQFLHVGKGFFHHAYCGRRKPAYCATEQTG